MKLDYSRKQCNEFPHHVAVVDVVYVQGMSHIW